MRRRVVFAVIFLAAFILLFRFVLLAGEFDTVVTAARFESARDNFTALRAFLYRIPKGGDLHTHLAGAVYAERFIAGPRRRIFASTSRTGCWQNCSAAAQERGRCPTP